MKIYFVGSHSSGKSTLARFVSEKYKLPMITEVARAVLSERELQVDSLRADIDLVNSYQRDVFYRQFDEEKRYEKFVSDRSILDALAYSAQHSTIVEKLISEPLFKKYLDILKNPNVIVFFVRPSKATMHNDGIREHITWDGIVAIDAMIKLLLEMFSVRYFQINADNMQERVRFISSVMSLVG